ncbi:uncharacterized protein LOC117181075 [Belonocnema kinseyi]|uniref:uncharacterized protein LOC117181075 n=1 Tax=Belonocnema kinseyi TaxID=2817044 RepID=UPI00143CFA52|nr:uncharacterized protein LOC117181075 [Belonocnema kinseyi]
MARPINKKNLKPILEELSADWNEISKLPLKSQKLMISNAKHGRLLSLYLLIFLYSSAFAFLLTPIFLLWKRRSVNETVQSLPFKSHYPFEFKTSPTYEFIYISQCASGIVITISTYVGRKVYELKWYNIKPQHVRSMILIMIRSQKPLELSARNFFSMSFSTFTNIIMSAFSYASFLLAINEKIL